MGDLTVGMANSGVVNGSKRWGISDQHFQDILDWAADTYAQQIAQKYDPNYGQQPPVPFTPTKSQILVTWVQAWLDKTQFEVRLFKTAHPVPPPPIDIVEQP